MRAHGIITPFVHVAMHIEQSPAVWKFRATRLGVIGSIDAVGVKPFRIVGKRKRGGRAGSASVFPFDSRW
jgi:hypothetical protein